MLNEFITEFSAPGAMWALLQVIAIDLVLAGDNAIVIGLAAAGLPKEQRKQAILVGILAATVLRIVFALITTQLLAWGPIVLLVGGLLLFYVCWKMWTELSHGHSPDAHEIEEQVAAAEKTGKRKTFSQAAWQIVIADVSMSLDNVLAVAGAAKDHPAILVVGLALAIAMMGFAASFIANLLSKHRWIAYVGLAVIVYVALKMTLEGLHGFYPEQLAFLDFWLAKTPGAGH